ncbi:MAG: arsenate reductase ArsC [Luteimonas sp.]
MNHSPINVLYVCTHNSARSILAEGITNLIGLGRLVGHSAGSTPSGRVNPVALRVLGAMGCSQVGVQSKHWDTFLRESAPVMDYVITVCDNAACEVKPVWPGNPKLVHWSIADPSLVEGGPNARTAAFLSTADLIRQRIESLFAIELAGNAPPG